MNVLGLRLLGSIKSQVVEDAALLAVAKAVVEMFPPRSDTNPAIDPVGACARFLHSTFDISHIFMLLCFSMHTL